MKIETYVARLLRIIESEPPKKKAQWTWINTNATKCNEYYSAERIIYVDGSTRLPIKTHDLTLMKVYNKGKVANKYSCSVSWRSVYSEEYYYTLTEDEYDLILNALKKAVEKTFNEQFNV